MSIIYILRNKINNKCYVGQTTKTFNRRFRCHQTSHSCIGNALRKYGVAIFDKLLLESVPEEELDYWETHYIQECNSIYPNGYNFDSGGHTGKHLSKEHKKKIGESNKGKIITEETKKKLSESNKGHVPWMKGKHHTKESKRKLSEAHVGQKSWNKGRTGIYSRETKKKMSEAKIGKISWMKGKHHTEETRKKLSIKSLGNTNAKKRSKIMDINEEIKCEVSMFQGKQRIDIRKWFMDKDGKLGRSRNGLNIDEKSWDDLCACWVDVVKFVNKQLGRN
jgi:group I intron endonuclease